MENHEGKSVCEPILAMLIDHQWTIVWDMSKPFAVKNEIKVYLFFCHTLNGRSNQKLLNFYLIFASLGAKPTS